MRRTNNKPGGEGSLYLVVYQPFMGTKLKTTLLTNLAEGFIFMMRFLFLAPMKYPGKEATVLLVRKTTIFIVGTHRGIMNTREMMCFLMKIRNSQFNPEKKFKQR